jgi:alpha-D-ribose 1-methylphosphonate 5-triphosphate synthase subunit PhnH
VGLGAADHVFLSHPLTVNLLHDLRLGSDLHPEDGATLVVTAKIGEGDALRLTGPGVDGQVDVTIGGVPKQVWQVRAQIMRYPMGFEMFVIDGARVLGLPRSTRIEVL